jgi:hypothetical protein
MREKSLAGEFVALCGLAAAVLAVAAGLLGLMPPGLAFWTGHEEQPAGCTAQPAVTLPQPGRGGQVGDSFELAVDVHCPPDGTDRYVLISEVPAMQVDPSNPHPEYYLSWRMDRPARGTYTRLVNLSGYEIGARATYYVISLDEEAYAQLLANVHPTDFVLALPDRHLVASNRVTVVRSW